ncbi:hypothetical protein [Brevibacillus parabrevis]|uniref:SbsA Ig-like domain-containing protein n=1 Tax=Brevibacillus parabrevis TaxID=54914 RepID=A0A4Y3PLP3_BREPA|nr:hypothetical protein [Brevibacillus parabrevis]GEB31351.1 hypothetical protein BPA01_09310 [Brevibacillus parabrevis]
MNKKVVLSVLATAVVASMAASAFAAPKTGLYIGGNVKKFYSNDTLINMTKDARATYKNELKTIGFKNLVYVNFKGQGATIQEMIDLGVKVAMADPLKQSDFSDLYSVVNNDGTISGTEDARSKVDPTTPGELKVESVEAVNGKTIQIKFTTAVLKSTVVESDGTLVDNAISLASLGSAPAVTANSAFAELSEDGKTLTLTAPGPQFFNGEYAVTVTAAVTDANANPVAAYSGIVKNVDTVRPTVKNVTYTDNATAVVWFSEPLKDKGSVVLSDAGATLATFNPGDDFITVDLSGAAAATDITVSVVGAKDFNDNLVSPNPATAVVKKDTTDTVKPTVADIAAISDKVFTVSFSEKLKADPTIAVGGTPLVWDTNATISKDSTGLVYTVTLTNPVSGLQAVAVSSYNDLSNNPGDAYSKVVNFAADTTAPTVASYKVEKIAGVEYLVLTYSEDVTPINAKTINYTQVVDGVESTGSIVTAAGNFSLYNPVSGKSKSVKLDLSTLVNGQYTLSLPVGLVQDLASTPNNSAATTSSVTFTRGSNSDTTAPEVTSVANGADNNTVLVNFNEKLDVASALNINNYSIEAAQIKSAVFTTNGATATVKLTLEAGSVTASGERNITIKNVKDAAGNVITASTKVVNLIENVAPTVTSAKLTDTNEVTVTFSEAVANLTADDFELFVGTESTARPLDGTTPITIVDTKTLKVKVGTAFNATDLNSGIVVKPSATNDVEDAHGNALIFTSKTVTQ